MKKIKELYYSKLIELHLAFRKFYEQNEYLHNPMKVIYHDMRIQKYECELEKLVTK